jgi:hypothetical protein
MSQIYPLSYLPLYPQIQPPPVTFDKDYISNVLALGITSYFTPQQFSTNPLFAQVDTFNQNIGILQTATSSIEKILSYVKDLQNLNNPTKEVLKDFADEINSIIQNTQFNNIPVFEQSLKIGDESLSLSIPEFNPDTTNIEEYEKLLENKQQDFIKAIEELSVQNPLNSQFTNPVNFETFQTLLNSGTLLQAYNTDLINPETLQLLLS